MIPSYCTCWSVGTEREIGFDGSPESPIRMLLQNVAEFLKIKSIIDRRELRVKDDPFKSKSAINIYQEFCQIELIITGIRSQG